MDRAEVGDLLAQSAGSSIDAADLLERLRAVLAAHVSVSELRLDAATVELALPKDTSVDVEAAVDAIHEAEAALRAGRAPDAFGPSSSPTTFPGARSFPGERGSWVDTHRERLRGILLRALEARGEVFLWNKETSLAIEAAREVVHLEAYRETGNNSSSVHSRPPVTPPMPCAHTSAAGGCCARDWASSRLPRRERCSNNSRRRQRLALGRRTARQTFGDHRMRRRPRAISRRSFATRWAATTASSESWLAA